jgi:hypothetical protein
MVYKGGVLKSEGGELVATGKFNDSKLLEINPFLSIKNKTNKMMLKLIIPIPYCLFA